MRLSIINPTTSRPSLTEYLDITNFSHQRVIKDSLYDFMKKLKNSKITT